MDSSNGGNGSAEEVTYDSQKGKGKGKKQYHRHSAQQVQQLEEFFKEFPHPDESQRQQLSREIGLDPKQIKFWFQNKRTQKKAHNERADNNALRAENERIQMENLSMREALKNIFCPSCQGSLQQIKDQDQYQGLLRLRGESSRLKEQASHLPPGKQVNASGADVGNHVVRENTLDLFSDSVDKPSSSAPPPATENAQFTNLQGDGTAAAPTQPDAEQASENPENPTSPYRPIGLQPIDKAIIIETAIAAMDELVELLRMKDPLWITTSDGRCTLHRESYDKLFPKPSHFKSASARMESSKDSGEVAMEAARLVDIFLDPDSWKNMFPTIVTRCSTLEVIETGTFLKDSLHLMYEKVHILSPLVAPREFFFIRYIHQVSPKTWVMVDVSYDFIKQLQDTAPTRSWKLPSGCMIEDRSNGKSFITWIEHVQVDDKSLTHRLYRDLICTCNAYGARRWVATLQRMCDRFTFSMGVTAAPRHELEAVVNSPEGRRNLMRLSHRMVTSFCEVLSMSDRLDFPHLSELNNSGVRVALRRNNDRGQPEGLIVSAATSLWLPFTIQHLFNFFKDESRRAQWDIISCGNPVNAIAHISTGREAGNRVSIIQPFVPKENILMLQESFIDSLGATMIYAPIDLQSVISAVNGFDTTDTPILPSGYIISGDGRTDKAIDGASSSTSTSGSLLTVAFQILAGCTSVSRQLNMESVATVHSLISSTVQRIKEALGCPDLD